MSARNRAILLVIIQCLLVSSIAAKYLYERATRPRVWTRVAQFDPELPMRGRYLALSPVIDACDLEQNTAHADSLSASARTYRVQLVARDGKLVAENAEGKLPRSGFQSITLSEKASCKRAQVWPPIDYFIPEHASSPFDLKPGQELWVEVTVPPSGPPRAIQLALNDKGNWKVLTLK